jgi:glycosyltransferase involved in cell wall biosynthesis
LRPADALRFNEFEGVDVSTGGAEAFHAVLAGGVHRSVLVHFLDRAMWRALAGLDPSIRVVIWVHGAEVQPWWRRAYNYKTDAELDAAKPASDERLALWREVFSAGERNLHFVFVSEYFADEVMEDVGVRLEPERFSIIHNPIDVRIFAYAPKSPEQRLKVLSIRPFASAKYANDLTVAAIEMLSVEPGFDELEFRIIGDGELFEETLAPLLEMPNVQIERGFLSQPAIAALHREYGVFLVPTRMDAQGVSRDEAMASGLVPISNSVAAVPEFVDASSGLLVEGEDARGLADAVIRLRDDAELFSELSANAAARVRRQSAVDVIIDRELALVVDGFEMDRLTDGLEE